MSNLPYISPELLESYQKEISTQASPATSRRKMASLKKFFGWAKEEGHLPENPIEVISRLPGPKEQPKAKKPLKVSNIIMMTGVLGLAVLVFLLVGRVQIPIPFRLAPAGEPTASLFPTASPTPAELTPTPAPVPAVQEESDPFFSQIYKDGVLTLQGSEPTLRAIGGLLIEAASLVLKTEDNSDGDIEINPDGSGIAHFLFEGTGQNFLNAQAPNLTSGSLYYGIVANNATGYDLLRLQSGSTPTTRFSVDALGNTYLGGNITIGNNLIIGGATRLTNLGRLTSITGYYQNSGIFDIDQGGPDYVNITKSGVTATADAVTITLDETGQTSSNYDALVLSRLNGGSEALALLVDDGHARFDGQLQLGRFSANPGSIGTGSIIYNTSDNKIYFWNGSVWTEVGAGSTLSFTNITSGTNTAAAMVVGSGASLTFSGTGTITASDLSCSDCLDFTEFADNLTLDASTDIALGALTLSTSGTGALNFASTGQVTLAGNVDATNGLDVTGTSLTVGTSYSWTTAGVITAATDETINGIDISAGAVSDVVSLALVTAGNTWASSGNLTISGNLDVNGTTNDIAGALNLSGNSLTSSGDLTIDATGNNILSPDSLNFGGAAAQVYNFFAASTAGASAAMDAAIDLYVQGDLEVDGTIYGTISGSVPWNNLTNPTAPLSLNHSAFTTTFAWTSTGALDAFTINFNNNSTTATTQNALILNNAAVDAFTDTNTENLLLLQQLDTTTAGTTVVDNALKIDSAANAGITDAIEITNSAGNITNGINLVDTAGGTFTTGVNFSGTFTNEISLRNAETISNATDGTITLAANSGAVTLSLSGTAATISNTAGNLTLDSASNTLVIAASDTALTASGIATIDFATTVAIDSTTYNLGGGSATTIQTPSGNANLTIAANGTGIITVDPTGAGSIVLGSADVTSITFTTDNNAANDFNFVGGATFNDEVTLTLAGTEALTINNTTQGAADLVSINPTWTADNTADALAITTTYNVSTVVGTQYGLNLTNADNGVNTGVIDALALFSNDQATETLADGVIIRHNAASGTLTDALQIQNTTAGGTITNAINIVETAGTITTGINLGAGLTTGINTNSNSIENIGDAGTDITSTGATFGVHVTLSSDVNEGLSGGGLTDCDTPGTSKLLWDTNTNKFSCGTDQGGSGAPTKWNAITNPDGNLSLSHNEFTSTFTWDTAATAATFDGFTLSITNDSTTDTTTQRLLVLQQNDDAAVAAGNGTEALLVLNNADANEAVTNGILFGAGGASTPDFTYGINFDAADFTTEIVLENAETIDNQTNGTITLGADSGALALSLSGTAASITNTAGNLTLNSAANTVLADATIQLTGGTTVTMDLFNAATTTLSILNSTGGVAANVAIEGDLTVTGGDITGANSETIDIGEADNGTITFTGVGETNNGVINFDLETNAYPTINTGADTILGLDEDLQFVGAQTISTSTGDLTIDSGGNLVLADTTINLTGSSPIIDLTSATTLSINTTTNRPITTGTGLFTTGGALTVNGNTTLGDSSTVDTLTGNLLTSVVTSGATTQTALSLATASLTTGEALDITATYVPTAGGTQSAIDINLTNSPSTTANTLRGIDLGFTDAGTLANTIYGFYVDVTTANANDTTYAAVFQGGNVGIGTTSPSVALDVIGDAEISSGLSVGFAGDGQDDVLYVGDSNFYLSFGSGNPILNFDANDYFQFNRAGNYLTWNVGGEKMRIDSSGNVGIGDTTPGSLLELLGSQPASVGTTPGTAATDVFTATGGTGGDTTIATTGIGGIGADLALTGGTGGVAGSATTASTGGKGGSFTFTGGTGGAASVVGTGTNLGGNGGDFQITGGTGGAASGGSSNTGGTGGDLYLVGGAAGSGGSPANGDVLLAITSGGTARGNVGIGTTTPGYKLDVSSDANIADAAYLRFGGNRILSGTGGAFTLGNWDGSGNINIRALAATNTGYVNIQPFNDYTVTAGTQSVVGITSTFAPTSGTAKFIGLNITPTINQTGTATGDYTALQVNATETAATGTNKLLADFQVGATTKLKIDNAGNVTTTGDLAVNGGDITTTATTLNIDVANTGTINFRDGTNALAAVKDQGDYVFWNLKGKGTTGNPATCAEGDIYYNAFDNTVYVCHETNTWEQLDGGGGGSSLWSALLDPTADLSLNNMAAYKTTFTWNAATGANNLFNFTDTLNNTGTGYLVNITTATGSTLKPFHVSAAGVEAIAVNAAGNVGIGNAAPTTALHVGTATETHALSTGDVLISSDLEVDGVLYLDGGTLSNVAGTASLTLTATPTTTTNSLTGSSWLVENPAIGNVGMAALLVNQVNAGDIFTASSGGVTKFTIANSGNVSISGSGTMLTVGGGTGKIDVGTVDPVFDINGTKYATYMAAMTGVKEETTGLVQTSEYVPGVGYRRVIDFKTQPESSDLWLFSKTTDLKNNIGKMVVLLSPSDNTKAWYELDRERYTLSIYTARPTTVSYRLTAPRFDYALWTNYNDNPASTGFQITSDGDWGMNDTGEMTPDPSLAFADYQIVPSEEGYQLQALSGELIGGFEAVAGFIAANIKAGAVQTADLTTEVMAAATATVDNLIVRAGLVSPSVQTQIISPLPDESSVTVKIGQTQEDGTSGFGELIIQDATGSSVASIDTQGNASFEGQVESESLKTNEATVAGTLYADSIKSTTLDEIQALLRQVEEDQNLLSQASSWNISSATDSGELSVNDLFVTNTLASSNLSLSNSLAIGSDFVIQENSLNTLSAPLSIQSLAMAPIELMAGKVRIETNGDVAISGNLFVAGKIESTGLSIKPSLEETDTASIDASGSGVFKRVTTDDLVVASSETSDASSIVNGEITTNATVGTAVIPEGTTELTIRNPKITDYTLVYVTPTSSTSNRVLYVKSKSAGFFTVGFSNPTLNDVSFNWWVVNSGQ